MKTIAKNWLGLFLLLSVLLAGCIPVEVGVETPTSTAPAPGAPTNTAPAPAVPTNTQPAPPTAEVATATLPPPASATPEPATPEPTPTDALPATGTPPPDVSEETFLILAPGRLSAVTSPVRVSGMADPTFEQNLVISVTDQDGLLLTEVPTTIQSDLGQRGPFEIDVAFAVASEQPGRISVYHHSARDGGLVHLTSVEVTLRPSGAADIRPAGPLHESLFIRQPAHLAEISGGVIQVSGWSDYVFESQLVLALCGEGGDGAPDLLCGTADNRLADGLAMLQSPDMGHPGPFEGQLTYAITAPIRARVVVYHTSARDGGLLHVSTREVMLNP